MKASGPPSEVMVVLQRNRSGEAVGVYSVCGARPLALRAAMTQAKRVRTPLLVEATANQANQYGGYTGLRSADFPPFVASIAERARKTMSYWSHPDVVDAVERLFDNLAGVEIPLPLLSRFLPAQRKAVRDGTLSLEPRSLVIDRIMEVTSVCSAACGRLA